MNLLYKSTRNAEKTVTASEAILKGLADDGGLFVPVTIPKLNVDMGTLKEMSYQETAYAVMKQFFTDFTEEELKSCITKAYDSKFDTEEIAPLVKADGMYYLELFHGATIAFKDMAYAMFYHEKYPFMLADVDRMVVGENAGLECKTASPYVTEQWENGKIPLSYQIQCLHYMAVCGAEAWYIAVLIYGKEFKYYRIERDEEMIADLIRIEQNFWEEHVLKRQMPSPDGSKLADSVITEYYKQTITETIPLTGFNEKIKRRQELSEIIGKMDTEKRQIEQELKLYLGEAEIAENEQYRVSWKAVQSNRLDEKRLKEEQPEIYEKYKKSVLSRRFTVKAA